ncbi:MAG: membrane protein insertion efficiency factor YidD [Candidatus Niyogibacteria bacterium RIFCSPLOWO2_12_FULL_41_13]|uniref:Putative membrane protein insertion efficiency factor n=1 Tax=Candidatus Niyogibacteria bacterium RIFCSPLOWO2_12_FULL_41_13 TaxID=1801726 RepID=A0A1G2F381_9BACT|nr:MAG: membrane protein insertion efficiency factor YidD [Candidatus Niyogibacteria bacterium RIFCSPLOWO2_12_FULL_41_13]
MNNVFIRIIGFYQFFFSNIFGRNFSSCKFYPPCSHYGKQAFAKLPFLRALKLTIWRILRCNPFNKGGYDPINN